MDFKFFVAKIMSSKNFQKLYVSKILRLSAVLLFFKDRKFYSRLLKFKYLQDISGCVLRLTYISYVRKKKKKFLIGDPEIKDSNDSEL